MYMFSFRRAMVARERATMALDYDSREPEHHGTLLLHFARTRNGDSSEGQSRCERVFL